MYLLVNTDLGSSLGKTFCILVVHILSNLSNIFYIIVRDLTTIGIWEETPSLTSSYSLNLTAKLFPSGKTLLYLRALCYHSDVVCSFIFWHFSYVYYLCCSFLSSSFLFFMLFQSICIKKTKGVMWCHMWWSHKLQDITKAWYLLQTSFSLYLHN